MSHSERKRRHHANVDRIQGVQRVVGQGDRMRVDHEGTLLERARLLGEEISSYRATELGLEAFDRLLRLAEARESPHTRDVVAFLAAVWNRKPSCRHRPVDPTSERRAVISVILDARQRDREFRVGCSSVSGFPPSRE